MLPVGILRKGKKLQLIMMMKTLMLLNVSVEVKSVTQLLNNIYAQSRT